VDECRPIEARPAKRARRERRVLKRERREGGVGSCFEGGGEGGRGVE